MLHYKSTKPFVSVCFRGGGSNFTLVRQNEESAANALLYVSQKAASTVAS